MTEYHTEKEIPQCVRRNFGIKGYDIVDPSSLPTKSLSECQELCLITLGCEYFSWSETYLSNGLRKHALLIEDSEEPITETNQCFLKLKEAAMFWNEESTHPNLNVYSGPAKCGKTWVPFRLAYDRKPGMRRAC